MLGMMGRLGVVGGDHDLVHGNSIYLPPFVQLHL